MSSLKIIDIKSFWCGKFPFIQVYTNEGITGIGENVVDNRNIHNSHIHYLKDLLINEDPFDIERLWLKMYHSIRFCYAMPMISAVDMALWDIKAKKLGVPVYELLGGKVRNKLRLYTHLKGTWNSFPDKQTNRIFNEPWGTKKYTPEQLSKFAKNLVDKGYTAIKFDPFRPGIYGYHSYTPSEIEAAVNIVSAVRLSVGKDIDLMIECHGKFNASTAIKIGKRLEKYNIMWFEEPVPAGFLQAMKKVSDHVNIPLALGERFNSKWELKEYLENGIGDIIMFDLGKVGGITEGLKICTLCETYQIKASPHNPYGPVNAIAAAHLSAAVSSFIILEYEELVPWAVNPRLEIVDGYLSMPSRSGFGVELNEEEIRKNQLLVENGTYNDIDFDAELLEPAL